MPGAGEFGDEFFKIVEVTHGEAQQGHAGGGEEIVHEHVPLPAVRPLVAGVVQLDAEHGHPVVIAADQEVHVLLGNHLEGAVDLLMLEHIGQTRLDLDAAAAVGDLGQAVVEAPFIVREQCLGGVFIGHANTDFGIWGDELHAGLRLIYGNYRQPVTGWQAPDPNARVLRDRAA